MSNFKAILPTILLKAVNIVSELVTVPAPLEKPVKTVALTSEAKEAKV